MTGPLSFVSTPSDYTFFSDNAVKALRVSKPEGELSLVDNGSTKAPKQPGVKVKAIYGIIQLRLAKYVVVVTNSTKVGHLSGAHSIYRAQSFEFLPLKEWKMRDINEEKYLALAKENLERAQLFYSPTYDLTNSSQRIADHYGPQFLNVGGAGASNTPDLGKVDDRFFWNKFLLRDFIEAHKRGIDVSPFVVPCIFGVVSIHDTHILGSRATFGLISRRSRFRAGTRYFRRGIDNEGHVANYNETEQIVIISDKLFSHVQTRGSVPVFWAEINNLRYKPQLRVISNPNTIDAARLHFNEQESLYGHNFLVNLVNKGGYEKPVKEAYESLVANLNDEDLTYVYFDYHHECRRMQYHNVEHLITRLVSLGMDVQKYFELNLSSNSIERRQTSVVRTNCMDCLDRTNVVQSKIGSYMLQSQLQDAGICVEGASWERDVDFAYVFRGTWSDNADGVSVAYSGTGALKTDFTRLGKRTKRGALKDLQNSITRYVKNNYYDGPRQDGFDLVLGNHLPYETVQSPFIDPRPVIVQAMPYISLSSAIIIATALVFPRKDTPFIINRLFTLIWILIFLYSSRFIVSHGLQYVCWPKLCALNFLTRKEVRRGGHSKGWVLVERQLSDDEVKLE